MSDNRVYRVDKFLGLNESADGETELKAGEASVCENFYITDQYNLKSRPGVAPRFITESPIIAMWTGTLAERKWVLTVHLTSENRGYLNMFTVDSQEPQIFSVNLLLDHSSPIKIFPLEQKLYVLFHEPNNLSVIHGVVITGYPGTYPYGYVETDVMDNGSFGYIPVAVTGCAPSGGGTVLEPLNIIVRKARFQFSADGSATKYQLSDTVTSVISVTVDGKETTGGSFDSTTHSYTFSSAPAKGVNNVEFTCGISASGLVGAAGTFGLMRHCEAFNGATDSRIFFYGDGTNLCYYTGTPAFGSGLYIPAGNEITLDASSAPITGMVRHYSKLIAFQPDNVTAISYEAMTLADGRVTAGFQLRPVGRVGGNEMDNQIQLVNNNPLVFCDGTLYEWRCTSYRDERYVKQISQKVSRTLRTADPRKIVTCDDNITHTYYMFLNDDKGTVVVNRYDLDAWSIYTGDIFKGVRCAVCGDEVLFSSGGSVYRFDPDSTYDTADADGTDAVPVTALWESGFQSFGAPSRRKYSSRLWMELLPESASQLEITAQTDKRGEYLTKTAGYAFPDFSRTDFSAFSFLTYVAPKVRRVQLKVKKFVYYKLILRITKPGTRATVLGYEQQVRFSSNVK